MPRAKKKTKVFILDTNVILFDHTAIYHFEDNDVVLPIIVLEELDKFKKGNDLINFEAREFIRQLDQLTSDKLFSEGVSLGQKRGRLFVSLEAEMDSDITTLLIEHKADNRILALTSAITKKYTDRKTILITKDINLRMKAKAIGLEAEDYETGKVLDIDQLYTGRNIFEDFDIDVINKLYMPPYSLPLEETELKRPVPNQYFILKNNSYSAIARFNPEQRSVERLEKHMAYGIEPRNAEQIFALDCLSRPEIQLVALTGKAGTGKTLLALAAALEQRKLYRQIYLARPVVPLANKDLGYLPGNIESKLDPYMQPLFDNLNVIRHQFTPQSKESQKIDNMLDNEKLFIAPLSYIRGRSLDNIFFIVDEAQNLTPHEVKTIITRAGANTKVVFTGDIHQIDTPYLDTHSNGLTYLIDRMSGQNLFGTVNLVKGERSELAELASDLL
jgi:PhoH-like ATPase